MARGTKKEDHPRSMRGAIDKMCRSCLFDPRSEGLGSWRQQTEACTSQSCPLWKLRPKPTGGPFPADPVA